MKVWIVLIGLLTSSMAVASDDSKSLIQLHEEITRAYMLDGNVAPLDEATRQDYFLVAGIGLLETKEHVLQTADNLKVTQVSFHNDRIIINDDTAILTGTINPVGTIMGHPLPQQFRYLSVFIKEQGSWKLQARSITPVRKPATKS
ncbi:nuclear transport factor 2 family protein [Thalassotalea litorea]|uniref:Nuclear transport factor 2 family protein n=1 Tax=Thalassotalea litorea TaxID=2020715 RepID=A0A5R9IQ55_9GAMM|nr:nuclear transport factor 2 family protein [Thalassotalea litorea]TLU66167.1 nuclear transport factor 2 family protein [Thalassotalea litorea]